MLKKKETEKFLDKSKILYRIKALEEKSFDNRLNFKNDEEYILFVNGLQSLYINLK